MTRFSYILGPKYPNNEETTSKDGYDQDCHISIVHVLKTNCLMENYASKYIF